MAEINLYFPTAIYVQQDLFNEEQNKIWSDRIFDIQKNVPSGGKEWEGKTYTTHSTFNLLEDELFAPLFEGDDAVSATAKQQQAIGRVFRPGQRGEVQVYRILLRGLNGEATLDREMIARNRDEKTIQAATSANV